MDNRIFGYARVSSADQNLDRQLDALGRFPVQRDQIYADKASGKDFKRPQYQRLLRRLREGDVLVIKSIDRLGRNYREVLDEWRRITVDRRAAIVVLDMPLLDTRKGRDLIGTLISDIVLQLLSYVAQTEREFIHQRQAEGIAAAKARGVKFGRKPKERPAEYEHLRDEWRAGRISARAAARQLGVAHRTFMKWVEQENSDC